MNFKDLLFKKKIPVLITGSRTYLNGLILLYILAPKIIPIIKDIFFVVGDCPTGADSVLRQCALYYDIPYKEFTADWDVYGKAAGPMRNEEMAVYIANHPRSKDAFGFAFWDYQSPGTANMLDLAMMHGIPVDIHFPMDLELYITADLIKAQDAFKKYKK